MSHRFFLDQPPENNRITLSGEQAHHAANVMRFKEGDTIEVFDGRGMAFVARILTLSKKQLTAEIVDAIVPRQSGLRRLTLAVALPKGDRQKVLVEKLVELGVSRLVPLRTRRSVAAANEKVIQRLRKQVIEASKQCGRNELMEISDEMSIDQLACLQPETADVGPSSLLLLADPYVGPAVSSMTDTPIDVPVVAAIGPEGGFDSEETEKLMTAKWQSVRLGPTILRIETAAMALAAVFGIGSWLGDKD